jgi:hypothetical protein
MYIWLVVSHIPPYAIVLIFLVETTRHILKQKYLQQKLNIVASLQYVIIYVMQFIVTWRLKAGIAEPE